MLKDYIPWLKQALRQKPGYLHLKHFYLFRDLNPFELYLVNNCLHQREYQAGEVIFEEDYPLEAVLFIQAGEIEVRGKLSEPNGTILRKHHFIGLIDLFLENKRSSSAKALTPVTVLALSKNDLWDLIDHERRLGIKLLKAACRFNSRFVFDFISANRA
jgi:CRP-like cAMP-binding protein